jgi:hypothetical protein
VFIFLTFSPSIHKSEKSKEWKIHCIEKQLCKDKGSCIPPSKEADTRELRCLGFFAKQDTPSMCPLSAPMNGLANTCITEHKSIRFLLFQQNLKDTFQVKGAKHGATNYRYYAEHQQQLVMIQY